MSKPVSEKQLQAKRENDREMLRTPTGYLIKQRAFLKMYMITLTEQNRLYGHLLLETMREEFKALEYKPSLSEIYKSLHDLIDQDILEPIERIKEGSERKKVIFYRIKNQQRAESYKKEVEYDMKRSSRILLKAIEDNFG